MTLRKRIAMLLLAVLMTAGAMPVQASAPFARTEAPYKDLSEAGKTGWQVVGKKKYYYMNGTRKSGKVRIGNNWYFFGPEMKTGLIRDAASGACFYAGSSGALQTGWKTIGKNTYYFRENSSGHFKYEAALEKCSVNGTWYLFSEDGVLLRGLSVVEGKVYYADSRGRLQTGFRTVNGRRYYFEQDGPDKGSARIGFGTVNKDTYYFAPEVRTGLFKKNGAIYLAGPDGVLQTGWKTVRGKKYYFDTRSHAALTGKKLIAGRKCNFDKNGVLNGTAWEADTGKNVAISSALTYTTAEGGRYRLVRNVDTCKGKLTYIGYDQHKWQRNIDGSGCRLCSFLTVASTFGGRKINANAYKTARLKKVTGTARCPISFSAGIKILKKEGIKCRWVKVLKNNAKVCSDIASHLRKGMPVIISLYRKTRSGRETKRYTNENHFATLIGITENGKMAYLLDSGARRPRYVNFNDICRHIPSARADANDDPAWAGWGNTGGYVKIYP